MIKKKHLACVALVIGLSIIGILALLVLHNKASISDSHYSPYPYRMEYNNETYVNAAYLHEKGGEKAYEFLPGYEDIEGSPEITFGICTIDSIFAPNWMFQFKTAYMLSLQYSSEQADLYESQKEAAVSDVEYSASDIGMGGKQAVYMITSVHTEFPDYVSMVLYNDESHELIYVFYYDTKYNNAFEATRRIFRDYPFSHDFFVVDSDTIVEEETSSKTTFVIS